MKRTKALAIVLGLDDAAETTQKWFKSTFSKALQSDMRQQCYIARGSVYILPDGSLREPLPEEVLNHKEQHGLCSTLQTKRATDLQEFDLEVQVVIRQWLLELLRRPPRIRQCCLSTT